MKTDADVFAGSGFGRVDLLAVLAVAALVGLLAQPVWGNSEGGKGLLCRDNFRRLATAWHMFADDHEGRFVGNVSMPRPDPARDFRPWTIGKLTWDLTPDNTNTVYLTHPTYANLSPYLAGDASVYKCPSDDYLSMVQARAGWTARLRSCSMNAYVGEGDLRAGFVGPLDADYSSFRRWGDLRRMSPARLFVFVEEHPDSIWSPTFIPPGSGAQRWYHFPASFHGGGSCHFSFADGHVEARTWEGARMRWPVGAGAMGTGAVPLPTDAVVSPDDPDLVWVRERASELR